jgi:hypothetical protein
MWWCNSNDLKVYQAELVEADADAEKKVYFKTTPPSTSSG